MSSHHAVLMLAISRILVDCRYKLAQPEFVLVLPNESLQADSTPFIWYRSRGFSDCLIASHLTNGDVSACDHRLHVSQRSIYVHILAAIQGFKATVLTGLHKHGCCIDHLLLSPVAWSDPLLIAFPLLSGHLGGRLMVILLKLLLLNSLSCGSLICAGLLRMRFFLSRRHFDN